MDEPSPIPSDAVLTLIDPEADDQTQLTAMRKLGYEISEQDVAALKDFLMADISSVANRIIALRLCGEQGNVHALETARNLAQNGDTTMLRCVAIATLGEIGTEEDLALLETYAASTDDRIQRIAQNSLIKLGRK